MKYKYRVETLSLEIESHQTMNLADHLNRFASQGSRVVSVQRTSATRDYLYYEIVLEDTL